MNRRSWQWIVMVPVVCASASAQQPVSSGAARQAAWELHRDMVENAFLVPIGSVREAIGR